MADPFRMVIDRLNRDNSEPGDYVGALGLLMCGKCKTPKQADIILPADGEFPEETVRVNAMCDCAKELYIKLKAKDEERRRSAHIEELRTTGIRSASHREYTFREATGGDPAVLELCRRYVNNWNQMKDARIGMMFIGNVGTGKTYLAACIANALIDKGLHVLMLSTSDLLSMPFDDRDALIDDIGYYRLIVLDDLGAERSTPFGIEQVKRLIDAVDGAKRMMIVTTNLSLKDIEDATLPIDVRRIYDRVNQLCTIKVAVLGESRREQEAVQRAADAMRMLGY